VTSPDQAIESSVGQASKEGIGAQEGANSRGKFEWSHRLLAHNNLARNSCTLRYVVDAPHNT